MDPVDKIDGGIPLQSLGDIQRAMARTLNEMRVGRLEQKLGASLMLGYSMLASVMQDRRDSKWAARTRKMWEEFQKLHPTVEPAHAEH